MLAGRRGKAKYVESSVSSSAGVRFIESGGGRRFCNIDCSNFSEAVAGCCNQRLRTETALKYSVRANFAQRGCVNPAST